MDKFAQSKRETGRGFTNWIREKANIPGSYLDSFFKPELDRVMTALKKLDDQIRSEVTGTKIGASEAPEIQKSCKQLLKEARTSFNRREYMNGISDLGMFHRKIKNISNEIAKFGVDVNKIHHKFLFEGADEEKLNRLRSHMERKAALELAELTKEAGIMDFFHNIGTARGRALAAWEKKYPKETKALREGGAALVNSGEALLESVISSLKEMAVNRAQRRPDAYMDAANKIRTDFAKFDSGDKGFTAYYNNVILPFIKTKDEIEKSMAKTQEAEKPTTGLQPGQTELGEEPPIVVTGPPYGMTPPSATPVPAPVAPPGPQPAAQTLNQPPGASPPFAPPPRGEQMELPLDQVPPPPDTLRNIPAAIAHRRFMASLEAMGNEDPRILASYIAKYAKSIQGNDPETAIQLFSIVRQLKG